MKPINPYSEFGAQLKTSLSRPTDSLKGEPLCNEQPVRLLYFCIAPLGQGCGAAVYHQIIKLTNHQIVIKP